jgi:glutamate formiminotransferase / 5-formyltetrahydrofolate cyclo-ligase
MTPPILLAVPNFSEGRDMRTISAIGRAITRGVGASGGEAAGDRDNGRSRSGVRLLDVHRDGDHHRSVFTLCGRPGELADALLAGAAVAVERVDVMGRRSEDRGQDGEHPYVGALDVAPVVYLDVAARGAACAESLVVADRIGQELDVQVFLYGELTSAEEGSARTRAQLRRGGLSGLAERMRAGLRPDFGPSRMHPTAGATLVAAREPLVAFNVQLAPPATVVDARAIAALIREGGGEGLSSVRAIGVALGGGIGQVSMNIERPLEIPVARVIEAVRRHAAVSDAEFVGLAPRAALEGFPQDVPLPGFDPTRHVIENALGF